MFDPRDYIEKVKLAEAAQKVEESPAGRAVKGVGAGALAGAATLAAGAKALPHIEKKIRAHHSEKHIKSAVANLEKRHKQVMNRISAVGEGRKKDIALRDRVVGPYKPAFFSDEERKAVHRISRHEKLLESYFNPNKDPRRHSQAKVTAAIGKADKHVGYAKKGVLGAASLAALTAGLIAARKKAQKPPETEKTKVSKKLTYKARENLSEGAFVFPQERRYPIHDAAHARNALARASGKPEEGKVRAAVHARYPDIGKEKTSSMHMFEKNSALAKMAVFASAAGRTDFEKVSAPRAKKKDDDWSRPTEPGFVGKHKKKLLAGLAAATAAGVGRKLYKAHGSKLPNWADPGRKYRAWKKVRSMKPGSFKSSPKKEVAVINETRANRLQKGSIIDAAVGGEKSITVNKFDTASAESPMIPAKTYVDVDKKTGKQTHRTIPEKPDPKRPIEFSAGARLRGKDYGREGFGTGPKRTGS